MYSSIVLVFGVNIDCYSESSPLYDLTWKLIFDSGVAKLKHVWGKQVCFPCGKQTRKSLNCQNGFRTTLERLSCHNVFKIAQAQTKVSFFHLSPLLQVEFRAIFEPFSYILLNGSNVTQCCHVCKSQTTSGPPVVSVVRGITKQ